MISALVGLFGMVVNAQEEMEINVLTVGYGMNTNNVV